MGEYLQKSKAYKGFHYSELNKESLDYLHNRVLEMFKAVKQIFDSHKIQYMICGGTLLGACPGGEANGKFIPWDDDFDVCIFEEDYERARDLLINDLASSMVLHCSKTDEHYYHGWMKVKDKKSHVYPDDPTLKYNGVWIDLYMLKKVKKNEVNYLIVKEHFDYLKRRLSVGGITEEEFQKRIDENDLIRKIDREKAALSEFNNNGYVYLIWSASKISLEEEWVLPLQSLTLEGVEMTTFNQYKKYLLQHYGNDFRKFPPESMRRVSINRVEIEQKKD